MTHAYIDEDDDLEEGGLHALCIDLSSIDWDDEYTTDCEDEIIAVVEKKINEFIDPICNEYWETHMLRPWEQHHRNYIYTLITDEDLVAYKLAGTIEKLDDIAVKFNRAIFNHIYEVQAIKSTKEEETE